MLTLGLLCVFLLEGALCFVNTDTVALDTAPQYCADADNCSLISCDYDAAKTFCPKQCGHCSVCEDKNNDCSSFVDICEFEHILQTAAITCPKSCKFCEPCEDKNNTICPGLGKFCDNPNVLEMCPKTCNRCKVYNATRIIERYKHKTTVAQSVNTATSSTTVSSFTTAPTTPAKPPMVTQDCDKFGVIVNVAKGSIVQYAGTPSCPDNVHQPSESLIQKYCGAPNISVWSEGEKVVTNCNDIPHYTAIAAVKFGGATVAGVFIKCETDGFQAAIQLCDSPLKLYHLKTTSTSSLPSADKFVVIDWKH